MKREPTRREQLRRAFHGPILSDFAQQVWVPQPDGTRIRYAPAAWKVLLAQLFAVPVIEKRHDGEIDVRHSTERLTDQEFHDFMLASQAFGAELGVTFTEKPPC